MAEIRKVVPSAGVSNFQQVAADGGGAFRVLADGLNEAYEFLKPKAIEQRIEHNADIERQIARQQIGNPAGGLPTGGTGSSGGISASLARTESGGNYQAQNSEGYTGKYQWGQGRLNDYNNANGTSFSLAEFKASPQVQETAQKWHEGDILSQIGGYAGRVVKGIVMTPAAIIAAAHLGGIGGARKFIESDGAYDPADSNGTNLSDYARTHGGADSGGSGSPAPYQAPTMIRDADGKLQARLLSPMGGEVVQASNAAAGVAYQSEMMLKGLGDLMGMSNQFPLDPQGFQQASQSYVDEIVDKAPEMFRSDLRVSLEREARQRTLGMMEEQQRDTRQRASNSSAALVDRWSDNLAGAIAGGNPDDIAAAQGELDGILAAREALPGISWTPEQSDNVRIETEKAGQAIIKQRQSERAKADVVDFDTSRMAAKAGMTAEAEGRLLTDPAYARLYPDRVAELRAWTEYRDLAPTFDALSIDEQDAMVTKAFEGEVQSGYEVDVAKALAARANSNRTAQNDKIELSNTMAELRDDSMAWNPYDSDQRGRVDDAYVAMLEGEAPLSDAGVAVASNIVGRTGFPPNAMVDAIKGSLKAGDPVALTTAMEFAGQLVRGFPNAFGVYGGAAEINDAVADFQFLGRYMSGEEAALSMVAENTPEAIDRKERMATTITAKAKLLKTDDIVDHFSGKLGVDIEIGAGDASDEIMSEYQELFERAFITTGNADLAKNRALESISRVYGPAGVNGSEHLMRYPPVSFYPARDGGHDWMRAQLERDVTEFATGADLADDEDTRNWLGFSKSGTVNADNIMLVADAGTQADVAAGRMPSYSVQFLDDDDTIQSVPGRYRFNIPAEKGVDKERFDAERSRLTGKSNLLAWKEYFLQAPDRSQTIPDIDRMLSENRDKYMAEPPPELP